MLAKDNLVIAVDSQAHLLLQLLGNLFEVSLDSDDLALLAPQRVIKVFLEEDGHVHEEHAETIFEGLVGGGELLYEGLGEKPTTSLYE